MLYLKIILAILASVTVYQLIYWLLKGRLDVYEHDPHERDLYPLEHL